MRVAMASLRILRVVLAVALLFDFGHAVEAVVRSKLEHLGVWSKWSKRRHTRLLRARVFLIASSARVKHILIW